MESEFSFNHQYSLKWNDFHRKIIDNFQNLKKLDEFVDVTISCEDCTFSAHKVVLSACSPLFRKLLKSNPCQHPVIILQTIGAKNFESLLSFMYNGVVSVEPENLHEFLKAAAALKVQGLADIEYSGAFKRKFSTESNETCEKPEEANDAALQPLEIHPDTDMELSRESCELTTPKSEPSDDLVIDEDAFEKTTPPQDIPTFSGSEVAGFPEQFTQHVMSFSENFLNQTKKNPLSNNRCIVCKRNYSSPSNLRAHVLNVHIQTSKTNWFECRICKKKCKTKHYLINHEMQKHGIRQRTQKRTDETNCGSDETV